MFRCRMMMTGLLCAVFGMCVYADSAMDFQSASTLLSRRKYEEAENAFLKLAEEQKENAGMYDQCHVGAVRAVAARKKLPEALALAEKIKDESVRSYAQLLALSLNGKNLDINSGFAGMDFSKLPEQYISDAYHMRGRALRDASAAIDDLEQAEKYAGLDKRAQALILMNLSQRCYEAKQREKAYAALDRAIALNFINWYPFQNAARLKAQMLIEDAKFADAEKLLPLFDRKEKWVPGNSWFLFLILSGDIEFGKGDKAKAVKLYEQELDMETVSESLVKKEKGRLADRLSAK